MTNEQPAVDVPPDVLDYLSQQSTLSLATASAAGVPRAATFLYVNDGPDLYFWTKAETTTARHVQQNPAVAFTIDEYARDLSETRGVQGTGECSVILSGEQIARVADLFGQKFPNLSPGATMSISFFRIAPTELDFIDNTSAGAVTAGGSFGAEFHRERSYSVFSDLPVAPAETETFSASLQSISAEPGEVVVREGGPADKFFIVVEGELEVLQGPEGEGGVVDRLEPGQLFGEVSIMRDTPRASTVRAVTSARLLAIERDTFRDVMAQSLGTTAKFDEVIRERLASPGGAG